MPYRIVLSTVFLLFASVSNAASDFKWWTTSSPNAAPNGSITLKNAAGTSRTIASNPTGASLSTRTANTQPPTVIVQATASLPIKTEGSACTAVTSGTSPNQTADENHAISADRTLILTCQSGVWSKSGGFNASSAVTRRVDATSSYVCSVTCRFHSLNGMEDGNFTYWCSDGAFRMLSTSYGGGPFCYSGYYTSSVATCNNDEMLTYCSGTYTAPRSCVGTSVNALCVK